VVSHAGIVVLGAGGIIRRVEAAAAQTTNSTASESTEGTPPATPGEGNGTVESTSREAARYRTRLREVEAERDKLQATLDSIQTTEVERIAQGAGLAVAADVWSFGAELSAMRAQDGTIDAKTVTGTVEAILKDRPGLKGQPVGDLGAGRGAAAAGTQRQEPIGLSKLFEGRV
jgi:hypothetical protein